MLFVDVFTQNFAPLFSGAFSAKQYGMYCECFWIMAGI